MKISKIISRPTFAAALFLFALCARANVHTWTGAVNGLWSNSGNWVSNSPPEVIETLPIQVVFPPGPSRVNVTNDIDNAFFGPLRLDSLVITGNNYHFYGSGGGTNLYFSGRSGPFPNNSDWNIYCQGTRAVFDLGMNLVLEGTNTIANVAGTPLEIQSALTGPGGWRFDGSGQLLLDGVNANTCPGPFQVGSGSVALEKQNLGAFHTGRSFVPAVNGPMTIGYGDMPASVTETDGVFEIESGPLTINAMGSLVLAGVSAEAITNVTLAGGTISFVGLLETDIFTGQEPGTNYGALAVTTITNYEGANGQPGLITGHGAFIGTSGVFQAAGLSLLASEPGSNEVFAVNSGELILDTPIPYVYQNFFYGYLAVPLNTLFVPGPGTLVLDGNNAYEGNTLVESGVVTTGAPAITNCCPLGQASVFDPYAAAIFLEGAELVISNNAQVEIPLVLNGYGTNGLGAAVDVEHNGAAFQSGVIFSNDAVIRVGNAAYTLTIDGTQSPAVSGSAAFHKQGPGVITLTELGYTNCLTGTTYVDDGTLILDTYTNFGDGWPTLTLNGPVVIGVNGSTSPSLLELEQSEQLSSNVSVTINDGGQMNLQGNTQNFGSLTMHGGILASGNVILDGNITATNGLAAPFIDVTTFSLDGTNRTITVAGNSTLSIAASIIENANIAGFTKTGPGALDLFGSSFYEGPTMIEQGDLAVYTSGALGSGAGGVTVATGAQLTLENGVNVAGKALSISGGALEGMGTNSWTGSVAFTGPTTLLIEGQTALSGVINGPGAGVYQQGAGTLILNGTAGNSFMGSWEVAQGTLALSKTNAQAIAGPLLIGQGASTPDAAVVQLFQPNQINTNSDITINSDGLLNFAASVSCGAGSLSGSGNIALGSGSFAHGYDNESTSFSGEITGLGPAAFIKAGTGTMTFSGTSAFFGSTEVGGGTLLVDGNLSQCLAIVSNGAALAGNGSIGDLTALAGSTISSGHGLGALSAATVTFKSGATYLVEITGAGYDQINSSGSINLSNATLQTVFLAVQPTNSQYTIIVNHSGSAPLGTFSGLAEGAALTANNGAQLRVTYQGGSAHNVALTETSAATRPDLTSIIALANGSIQLAGSGAANLSYTIWACALLNTNSGNWTAIGTAAANGAGMFQFADTNAPSYPKRFYKLTWP